MTTIADPARDLAISYAPRGRRRALAALFALDDALGHVLRTTREPMVGQMRLAWWREALARLDSVPPPGEPVLLGLAADVMPLGVSGSALAVIVDGWEPLLGTIDDAAIGLHARLRGAALFAQAGIVIGAAPGDPLDMAGRGWALADLADHLSDAALASRVREKAGPLLDDARRPRWSRTGRSLGALVHAARSRGAGPGQVMRLAWHRVTGR